MYLLPLDTREAENNLVSRARCYDSYYRRYYTCRSSAWSRFGRWILAGVLIFVAVIFLFAIMCMSRRRRRRNQISSNQPMAYQAPSNNYPPASNDYYAPQGQQQQYAPPAGHPPYYGGNQGNAENQGYGVTQPQNAYTK